MREKNKFHFDGYACDGDTSTIEHGGYTITARLVRDDDMGAPWKEADGHGPVSKWTGRAKRAGERVLHSDHGSHRYYDFAEAVKIAKRDGWGWLPGKLVIERDGEGLGGRVTCGEFSAYDTENFNRAISEVYRLHRESMPAGEYAAKAAEKDFEALKAWCDDEWFYVGVVLSTTYNGIEILDHAASLWGIECNYPDGDNSYLAEVAHEMVDEALEASELERKRILAELTA